MYRDNPDSFNEDEDNQDDKTNILFLLEEHDEFEILDEFDNYSLIKFDTNISNLHIDDIIQNDEIDEAIVNEISSIISKNSNKNNQSNNDNENEETSVLEGYIENEFIDYTDDESTNEEEETDTTDNVENTNEKDDTDTTDNVDEKETEKEKASVKKDHLDDNTISKKDDDKAVSFNMNQNSVQGIALKDKTHVYAKQSASSSVLKSYSEGSILKYRSSSQNWYEAKVKVNGSYTTGYIHKSHVENSSEETETFRGIGIKSPTNVYAKASTNSKALKSYSAGTILKYQSFSNNWYKAKVKVNGSYTTGYIHKSHVENSSEEAETFRGIGIKSPTNVYAKASTNSKALKSYSAGTILKYQSFSNNWYKAKVKVNGSYTTGYIHKSHIENEYKHQEDGFGVGLNNNTQIYSKASTSSKALKSYKKGSILKYKTFSKNWHEVKVKVNGAYKTGYLHKSHVGTPLSQTSLRGIALKKPTKIYSKPFSSSTEIKTYKQGTILKYKEYGNGWYQANVNVGGTYTTGYIKSNDTETAEMSSVQETILDSFTIQNPTYIYDKASRNSKVIKSYKQGSIIKYKTLSKNWHEVKVSVNGSYKVGFINANDVGKISTKNKTTTYNISLNNMVKSQINNATKPKTSHSNMYVKKSALIKEKGKWKVKGKNQKVYNGTGSNKKLLGTIDERYINDTITVYENSSTSKYYKFHTWIIPLEDEVKEYVNPSNFKKGSSAYYQFALLSEPVYANPKEVNEKILKGKGVLSGQAEAFSKAAETYNINELYLISHALLETGNGTSALAKGGKYKGVKVYNMYGIGAADSCKDPRECGMKRAFEEKWFSEEAAIIGGAKFVAENYIHAGQDTLYKMRWDPTSHVAGNTYHHQYATDVGWAKKQTYNLANYYNKLNNYSITFDVPKYK